eukprot:8168455-Pyramimonas_sp.AAC.1
MHVPLRPPPAGAGQDVPRGLVRALREDQRPQACIERARCAGASLQPGGMARAVITTRRTRKGEARMTRKLMQILR